MVSCLHILRCENVENMYIRFTDDRMARINVWFPTLE